MSQEEMSRLVFEKIEPLLKEGKKIQIHPTGTSMYPLLTGNDLVLLAPLAEGQKVKVNDILLYRRDNGLLVVHRLCRLSEDGFFFVGDNQTEVEGPLKKEALLAVVTDVCRHGRWFSVKQPLYRILSRCWLFLRPVRPFISRPIGAVYRKVIKRN